MSLKTFFLTAGSLAASGAAVAGGPTIPLGNPLGLTLGSALGAILGVPLGFVPLGFTAFEANVTMLVLAAISLAIGVTIIRRKQKA